MGLPALVGREQPEGMGCLWTTYSKNVRGNTHSRGGRGKDKAIPRKGDESLLIQIMVLIPPLLCQRKSSNRLHPPLPGHVPAKGKDGYHLIG